MSKKCLITVLIGAVGLTLLGWSQATAQITTGGVTGKVVDEKGEALPGVLVTARNRDTGIERAVTSDSRGEYTLLGLPPAVYIVQATITGYGAPLKTVVVNLGQLFPLNWEMKPGGGLKEEVAVTAEPPLVNTTKSEVSTIVTERDIRSYPLLQRDYNDLAQLAPGVKQAPGGQFDPTKKEGIYTPFTTGGTSGRNVNISIDGADNNDNVVGYSVQGFTLEAVQEFEVVQDQYKAEYGRSLGGVINVITKSGTNDFSGSVFGYGATENSRVKTFGERISAADKTENDRYFYGFSIGGPIVKDKLFYFIAYEKQVDDTPIAISPAVTGAAGSEPAGFPFQIATPGTTISSSLDRDLPTVRVDWNVSKNHLIWARYSEDENEFTNDQGGALLDPSNQGNSFNKIWSAIVSWQWNIRGSMINEMKFHMNDFENGIVSNSPDPALTLSFDNFDLGRNINAPQATFQKKTQFRDDFSWIQGRHSFKTGLEYLDVEVDDSFLGPATTPALQFLFNTGVAPASTMVTGDAPGQLVGLDDGIEQISEVVFINPGFIPGTDYQQLGVYFQDDWEINDRWRVNAGVRVDADLDLFKDAEEGINEDFYECFDNPANDAACGRAPGTGKPQGFNGFADKFPEDPTNISPRIGFVYRFGGNDKDVLRGSWGLFYDKLIDNLVIFMRQNNSPFFSPALPSIIGFDPTDPTFTPADSGAKAGDTVSASLPVLPADFTLANWQNNATDANGFGLRDWFNTLTSIIGPATFDDFLVMPSPDWKTPYTSAYSVGWGHQFSPRLAVDTNLIYRRGFRQMRRDDFRGRQSGRFAPNNGGNLIIFTTEGKSEYRALQGSLKGRYPNFDFGVNVNISRAAATQDSAGTSPTDGGPIDIFEGGNQRFTGGDIEDEWGQVSGDQLFYMFAYGIYRLPLQFQVAGRLAYGTDTAFQQFAGFDANGDGFNSANEYTGPRGSGRGDDLYFIDLRGSKFFNTGAGTKLETFIDVFNLMNEDNLGVLVLHNQSAPNNGFEKRTGDSYTRPRTFQLGLRFTF